jgi:hypothetical protein
VYATPNNAPVASDDSFNAPADTPITITPAQLLANDSDPDGDTLNIANATLPTNGILTANGDGSFTYAPNSGFTGLDSFSYTVNDGRGGAATATVTITVGSS